MPPFAASRRRRSATPSARRPTPSTSRPLSAPFLVLAAAATLLANPVSAASSSYPQIDLSKLGSVALGGSFTGLSFFDPSSSTSAAANVTLSASRSTVFSSTLSSSDSPLALAQTNDSGSILSLCLLPDSSGSATNGTLFVGGSFDALSSTSGTANVGLVELSTGAVSALASGVDGAVHSLYCNVSSGDVWLGGAFSSAAGNASSASTTAGGRVLVWSTSTSSFMSPPFDGFSSGTVQSILPSSDESSLVFAGSFTTAYSDSALSSNASSSSVSGLPVPDTIVYSPGSTPFTASLTPISFSSSVSLTASPSSSLAGFSDADVLLCPQGVDGSGASWFAGDAQNALLTVNLNQGAVAATGIRIGNTFVDGRGTETFSLVVLPEDERVTLSYIDPLTGTNETCSASCPLSTNSSVPFQDFLFDGGGRGVSGFQVTLLSWTGDGAGLHLLELLSAGSYAPLPVDQSNTTSCASLPTTGSTSTNGTWSSLRTPSSLGGISSSALQATVDVSSFSASTAPSLAYYPYITGTGNYSVSLVVPGCVAVGDCDGRTSIDVAVQPYSSGGTFKQTIPPSRWAQTYELYRGAVEATSAEFSPKVSVAMASAPVGIIGDAYSVVVGRIELALLTVDTTGTGAGAFPEGDAQGLGGGYSNSTSSGPTPGTSGSGTRGTGFGVWEWAYGSNNVSATGTIGNGTLTAVDELAQALAAAVGSSGSTVEGAVELDDGSWIVAGTFSTDVWSNVVLSSASNASSLSAPAGNGLNGAVNAIVAVDSAVYLGGAFTSTQDGTTTLSRLAKYDPSSGSWAALAGGVDGEVTSLALSVDQKSLVIGGFFGTLLANASSAEGSTTLGGFALYDLDSDDWATDQAAAVFGDVASVATASASNDDDRVFFAGDVTAVAGQSAVGFAMLTSDDGQASIESLPLGLDVTSSSSVASSSTTAAASASTSSAASAGRRALHASANHSTASFSGRQWLPSALVAPAVDVVRRAFASSHAGAPVLARAPAFAAGSNSYNAPSVLAAAFWTNSSASDHEVLVLGGNFTSSSSASSNVLTYDQSTKETRALSGATVDGVVYAVEVIDDTAFVGGDFDGAFRAYDLKAQTWDSSVPSLNASDGSASVSTMLTRPSTSDVVVAGTFASAGSVACASICSWSTSNSEWSALSDGLEGSVNSFAFAGDNADVLFAAGEFTLGSAQAYVGRYFYDNQTWAVVEGGETIPGPASAVAVDDKNASAVFLAGTSSSDGSAYLVRWDGTAWSTVSAESGASALTLGSSTVHQLSFVPLSATHDGGNTAVVPADRALLASGALALADYGSYSSAMFDGAQWFPYVRSTNSDGSAGSVRGLYNSERNFSFDIRSFLAVGIVVVICMAIALGVIFLSVLIGLLIALWRRNRHSDEAQQLYPASGKPHDSPYGAAYGGSEDDGFGLPADRDPRRAQMLDHINAATEGVIAGGAAVGGAAALAKHERSRSRGADSDEGYPTEEGVFDDGDEDEGARAGAGPLSNESGEEVEARVAHARWSLTPEPGADRELRIRAGQPYLILNDADPEWWLALDPATGEQGAVPASWML